MSVSCTKCTYPVSLLLQTTGGVEVRQCQDCYHIFPVRLPNFRPEPVTFFLRLAAMLAERGTCTRANVGCVITSKSNIVLATGYNGSLPSSPHCLDEGCLVVDNHCVRTIHAEMNAIIRMPASEAGIGYCTHCPCLNCLKVGLQRNIYKWYYLKEYKDTAREAFLAWHNGNHPSDTRISLSHIELD